MSHLRCLLSATWWYGRPALETTCRHALSDAFAEPAGRVCYWELVDAQMVQDFAAHTGAVCSLSLHPAGTTLVTASNDGTIKVWK